jgi:hypothetical protein
VVIYTIIFNINEPYILPPTVHLCVSYDYQKNKNKTTIYLNSTDQLISSLLSLFWKHKSRLMRSPCCLCFCVSPRLLNAWTNLYETAYLINASHQSVCLYLYTPIVARQRQGKNVTPVTNTHATIELLDASFNMWSVSYQRKVGD